MRRVTREWDHMSIFPASDGTLAIDVHVPSDPSWPSEACEGWSGHWLGQERMCCDRKCFCVKCGNLWAHVRVVSLATPPLQRMV